MPSRAPPPPLPTTQPPPPPTVRPDRFRRVLASTLHRGPVTTTGEDTADEVDDTPAGRPRAEPEFEEEGGDLATGDLSPDPAEIEGGDDA